MSVSCSREGPISSMAEEVSSSPEEVVDVKMAKSEPELKTEDVSADGLHGKSKTDDSIGGSPQKRKRTTHPAAAPIQPAVAVTVETMFGMASRSVVDITGGASSGMQGVTELVRCERTADAWLTEVQQQLRYGQLSNDNHAFLHGRPTSVPGSWVSLAASPAATRFVQTLRPERIAGANSSPRMQPVQDGAMHASTRRQQRRSARGRSIRGCRGHFPTNDIKYHANKLRALEWASARKRHLHIAVAQDTASSAVLHEKPHLADDKLQWLQRHDKECGGLYMDSCQCASECPCEPRII